MRPHLNIQLCLYPFLDGGLYFAGPHGPLNLCWRVGLVFIDLRVWWVTSSPVVDGRTV